MADISSKLAGVHYYARERYFRKVTLCVLEVVKEFGADPLLTFWKGYSTIMEDRLSEGMRELEPIIDRRDVVLCAPLLLIYAHRKCTPVDREAIQKLETQVRTVRTTCGEKALYNASMFLWLSGKNDKAREYIDKLLKMAPNSTEGLVLKGWIDLTSTREALAKKSINFFDKALASPEEPKPVDALFGKSKFLLLRCNFSHSLEMLNQAVASFPGFLPSLMEKMKILLALQDWEQAVDTARRCLSVDVNCIEAQRLLALSLLTRDGNFNEAAEKISGLVQLVDRCEPSNHGLYYNTSLALARLSDGNRLVLQQTMTLVERAISLAPSNSLYVTELAYQHRLNGQSKECLQTYRKAFNMDETSVSALAGIIYCQITDHQIGEAEQQLEFLHEVQSSIGKQSELIFLHALLSQQKQRPMTEVLASLEEALDVHANTVKGTPLSDKYYQLINPHFLHQIATTMMVYAPTEPASSPSQVALVLRKAVRPVDMVLKCAPGMLRTVFLLAKIRFLSGDVESAAALVQRCMEQDSSSMDSHLLMAQIHLQQGNTQQCSNSLEMALSSNFEVQSYAVYHLVKALAEKQSGSLDGSLSSLQTALQLISSKRPGKSLLPPLSPSETVTVYLELVQVHTRLGHTHEAAKVMQDAINMFTGSPEEVRIAIANADLALARGDTEQALALLKTITDDKPYYIQAVEKMAQIYHRNRKDKKMYVMCYKDLCDKFPGPPTSLLLGDAYMNVQEPELAVSVYESALKANPRDGILASKVGQALVKTHHYNKAINYYEAALKTANQQFLRGDLAELYLKLKHYDRAEKTLMVALDHKDQESTDLATLLENVRYLLLLAKVHQRAARPDQALTALSNAGEMQLTVLKRVGVEQPDAVPAQKLLAAKICCQVADHFLGDKKFADAQRLYRDALSFDESYSEARIALAHLHLQKGELDACEQECVTLLRTDPDNERASVMRADLLFRKEDYARAAGHFQDILRRKPDHFEALAGLIELNRRAGELESSSHYLEEANKACATSAYQPGLSYCKGLMKRYQHSMNEALHCFNQARKDSEWGERALFSMVEICLNPENEMLGGETLKSVEGVSSSSNQEDHQMAVKTAEKLLKEMRPKSPKAETRVLVLENYTLLATKTKQNAERALERFMEMAAAERDSVPVLLGIATAHMILKQTPRARNQLKRVSKMTWTSEEAEEFEKCWILLADIFIQNNKIDVAIDLLKKCIRYNKSSSKTWEYRGYISEKDSSYKDAAEYYEYAWKYCNFSDPNVGFRLGFNYLKAKRFVDAIGVCHKVLEKYPDYPKIKKEILEKARQSLRP